MSANVNQSASGFLKGRNGKLIGGVIALAIIFVCWPFLGGIFEQVDAGEVVVRQGFFDGKLTIWTESGPKLQWWGKCTHYKRSFQYWFSIKKDQGATEDQSLKVRFNDGGHANISGSAQIDLPLDAASLTDIHKTYNNQADLEHRLIRTAVDNAVYFSGPLMSSTQSFAEKRNELPGYIEEQAKNGIFKSSSKCEKAPDPVTKAEKTVCMVEISKDEKGLPIRTEPSPLKKYNVVLSNLAINDIIYDKEVVEQIKAQQNAIAAVQTAAAQARQAEQRAITAAKDGEANAATAKWKQEVEKATVVTKAEQEKDVARLAKEAAQYTKEKDILLGEGEAARKKLVMAADGALTQKLAVIDHGNVVWAEAYAKVRPTPDMVFGDSGGKGPISRMDELASMMTMSLARQVGLSSVMPVAAKK